MGRKSHKRRTIYIRTKSHPLSLHITKARWNLFGHILRRPDDIPANAAMNNYFETSNKPGYRGKPPINLPKLLDEYLALSAKQNYPHILDHNYSRNLTVPKLKCKKDLEQIKEIAQDRQLWKNLTQHVLRVRQGLNTIAS